MPCTVCTTAGTCSVQAARRPGCPPSRCVCTTSGFQSRINREFAFVAPFTKRCWVANQVRRFHPFNAPGTSAPWILRDHEWGHGPTPLGDHGPVDLTRQQRVLLEPPRIRRVEMCMIKTHGASDVSATVRQDIATTRGKVLGPVRSDRSLHQAVQSGATTHISMPSSNFNQVPDDADHVVQKA